MKSNSRRRDSMAATQQKPINLASAIENGEMMWEHRAHSAVYITIDT